MRKLVVMLFISLLVFACQKEKSVSVNVTVKDKNIDEGVYFGLMKMDTMLQMNAEGKASVVLPVDEPQYGIVKYKWKTKAIYLEPGKGLDVIWDMRPSGLEIEFAGDGADKNNFINGKETRVPVMGDFGLKEDEFLEKIDQYIADNNKVLESKGFDKVFQEKEKTRLLYDVCGILWQYAQNRDCSEEYIAKMKSLMVEEDWLLQLDSYTNFMEGAVAYFAGKALENQENASVKEKTLNVLNYVLSNIKSQAVKEYLVASFSISYIDSEGVDDAEEVKAIFNKEVTNPVMQAAFNSLYAQGSSVAKGSKAHGFKYLDINGKEVSLDDFKGRYVYIDIWATWCAPCREEYPHLQMLEKAFQGTNISFVSISTDQDEAKWKQTVKDEKMGGIQLHTGGDEDFLNAFRVKGIPRFILINPEGRIENANMTRPSDPMTIEYLGMLQNRWKNSF
ncbi:MAG: TlpA family protein disulfide reductase [Sanguibacteroides justesenii]|uniref:TlpA family protein disulfide reductase n=1 Tax=Butyricimonas faecalis TaxID=2093856 RepID=UPI001DA5EE4B|nr:TlpA family protein disulfide reductase [Sanguibacteroides justesenii]